MKKKQKENKGVRVVLKGLAPLNKVGEIGMELGGTVGGMGATILKVPGAGGGKILQAAEKLPGGLLKTTMTTVNVPGSYLKSAVGLTVASTGAGERLFKKGLSKATDMGSSTKTKKKVNLKSNKRVADLTDDELFKVLREELFQNEVMIRLMKRVKRLVHKKEKSKLKEGHIFCLTENIKDKEQRVEVITADGNSVQIQKSWALEDIRQVEMYDHDREVGLYLVHQNKTYYFISPNLRERNELLFNFLQICQDKSKGSSSLVTSIDLLELRLLGADAQGVRGGGEGTTLAQVKDFLSPTEEGELENLLASHGTLGDVNELANQLNLKLTQLDAQNVAGLIEAQADVLDLVRMLGEATEQQEEINNWFNYYRPQVELMRDFINAMNLNDDNLATYDRNTTLLRKELQQIIEMIDLDAATKQVLEKGDFESKSGRDKAIEAAKALERALVGISELKQDVLGMAAVREQKKELEDLKEIFGKRLSTFLKGSLNKVKSMLENGMDERFKIESVMELHGDIQKRLAPNAPLFNYMRKVEPKGFEELKMIYVGALRPVYKRELKAIGSELRSQVGRFTISLDKALDISTSIMRTPADLTQRIRGNTESRRGSDAGSTRAPLDKTPSLEKVTDKKLGFEKVLIDSLCLVIDLIWSETKFMLSIFGDSGAESHQKQPFDTDQQLGEFFDSAPADLRALIEAADKMNPQFHVAILKEVHKYLVQSSKESQNQAGGFFKDLLLNLQSTSKQMFQKYIDDQVSEIQLNEVSVVRCGILLPIKQFLCLVDSLELYSGDAEVSDLYVYPAYKKYLTAIFEWLNSLGENEPKYKHIARFENFHHLHLEIGKRKVKFLESFGKQAGDSYKENIKEHASLLIHHNFDKLIEFSDQIDSIREKVGLEEVQFVQNKQNLQRILTTYNSSLFEKNISSLHKKLQKDVSTEEKLFPEVWNEVKEQIYFKYEHFESLVAQCYKNTPIQFSLGELTTILQDVERSNQ